MSCVYEKQQRGQLTGAKGGRERLITEKFQEVTWARLRGTQGWLRWTLFCFVLLWWTLNLNLTHELYLPSILFYKGQNWRSERCCDLPRIIKLTGSKNKVQTQAYLASSTSPALNLHSVFMILPCTRVCTLTHTPPLSVLKHTKLFLAQCLHTCCSRWLECSLPVHLLYSIWAVRLLGLSSNLTTPDRPSLIL